MDKINAVCECKEFSEEEKVVAIRRKLFEDYVGEGGIFLTVCALFVAFPILYFYPFWGGGLLGGIILSGLGDYFPPVYKCQFCGREINSTEVR